MKSLRFAFGAISLACILVACSSSTTPGGDSGSDTTLPPSPCPATEPANGSACTQSGLECEYGNDPRRECRDQARCSGSAWFIDTPSSRTPPPTWCGSVPPAMCPATYDAASGQACATQGAVCTYGGLLCECTNCVSFPVGRCDGTPVWQCDGQPPSGCPASAPRLGDPCGQNGLQCNYGCNSDGGSVTCQNGVWQPGSFSNCPISTRRAKRDIQYVSTSEADALAEQVRATRLATYEYTIPAMGGRRHLGFIIEDQPNSFAVDPEHSQVDLYGYTSMLVATVQAQDRQIRDLSRRVDELERRARAP